MNKVDIENLLYSARSGASLDAACSHTGRDQKTLCYDVISNLLHVTEAHSLEELNKILYKIRENLSICQRCQRSYKNTNFVKSNCKNCHIEIEKIMKEIQN